MNLISTGNSIVPDSDVFWICITEYLPAIGIPDLLEPFTTLNDLDNKYFFMDSGCLIGQIITVPPH